MRYRSSAAQRAFGALFRFARQPFLLVPAPWPVQVFIPCQLAALDTSKHASHALFCSVWVGNWSPRIILTYQLLSSAWLVNVGAATTAVATSAQSNPRRHFEGALGLGGLPK